MSDYLQPSISSEQQPGILQDEISLHEDDKLILVAEDNVVNQKIVTLLLEKLGLKAHVVNNGLQAVHAVSERDYPIVLMDCQMPEMDGFAATRSIRAMEMHSGKHTPIIAVTALAMVGDRERCIEAGMDDYLSKPIDKERLKNKLNLWMNNEFVFHNQKLAEVFFSSAAALPAAGAEPIDLSELEVFYGSFEEVEEVLRLFVTTGERQLPDLEAAISEHRSAASARLAHELKGASASIGAKELSLICLRLEQEVGQDDWTRTKHTLADLQRCFHSVKEFVYRVFQLPKRSLQS